MTKLAEDGTPWFPPLTDEQRARLKAENAALEIKLNDLRAAYWADVKARKKQREADLRKNFEFAITRVCARHNISAQAKADLIAALVKHAMEN